MRLNQVLLNLLSNAVKFTPENGIVHIALREEASSLGDDHVRIHLRVRDSGIGMSPEFRENIFESFSWEDSARVYKTEGTGLGMAITKYIVDAMHGTIEVESEPGKGTEFHVVLDLEIAEDRDDEMILPSWRMLVVDDDRQLCEGTVSSLLSIGLQAEWTLDDGSALALVEQRLNEGREFQIILLDWKLPGMDGIETAPVPMENDTNLAVRRVLLAEDNELNWEVAEALLTKLGLTLDWAENGKLCLEMFQASALGYYDAILMDIRMPIMNGYEATKAIRALERPDAARIPIVAMTADAFSEDVKRCLDCGMDAHTASLLTSKRSPTFWSACWKADSEFAPLSPFLWNVNAEETTRIAVDTIQAFR